MSPSNDVLERRRPDREHAAAAGRDQHLHVFAGRRRDVVLAGVTGALDDLARQKMEVAANDVADLSVSQAQTDELDQERLGGRCPFEVRTRLELQDERGQSRETSSEELDPVDDVDADAVPFEVLDDDLRYATAVLDERAAFVRAGSHVLLVSHCVDERVDGSGELEERGLGERHLGATGPQHVGQAERRDTRGQKRARVDDVPAQRHPRVDFAVRSSKHIREVTRELGRRRRQNAQASLRGKETRNELKKIVVVARLG